MKIKCCSATFVIEGKLKNNLCMMIWIYDYCEIYFLSRYHIYCVGLRRVPEGRWHCQECAMCNSCGVSDPGPGDSKWFYEVIVKN